uniref:E3 ubiquitin-protein ligase COP1 n=1 Tax=Rhizophora mucronata TaxID=61149 RepID=A0A2P2KHY9_RHIMU
MLSINDLNYVNGQFSKNWTEAYCQIDAGPRIILDRTNICFHINFENTCFFIYTPDSDLTSTEKQRCTNESCDKHE